MIAISTNKDIGSADDLKKLIDSGILDLTHIQAEVEAMKKRELLDQYQFKIWQGSNSYWYTYVMDGDRKKLVKKVNRRDVEDIVVGLVEYEINHVTIDMVFTDWCDRRLRLKQIARSTYDRDLATYNKHFGEFGKKDIKDLDAIDIVNFIEEQVAEHELTAKGFARLKGVMYGILKHARRCGYTHIAQHDVSEELEITDRSLRKVIREDRHEVFDEDETDRIISYIKSNPDMTNLAILLMFVTGMRIGEIVAIKTEDIVGDYEIKIRRTETCHRDTENGHRVWEVKEYPKTQSGVRSVIVPQDYQWVLKRLRMLNPWGEYLLERSGKRYHTDWIRRRLELLCNKLDITHKTPHKIRKTYGTILLDSGCDNRLITDLMGHSNVDTTENYYHRNRKSIKKKHDLVSSIPDFKAALN